MKDDIEDLRREAIRLGRTYGKHGLSVAAFWVEHAGKLLGEVSEMLRSEADALGPREGEEASEPAEAGKASEG